MSWPNRDSVAQGVVQMLNVNMGLKSGERLLVLTDRPRVEDWQAMSQQALQSMLERAVLARLVADIARDHLAASPASFLPFPATGGHGREPDEATALAMRQVDVVIALTTYSLSHTNAREAATQAGARVASMPGFEAQMLEAGGPMAVDYRQVAADCRRFADLLSAAHQVLIRTPAGTDLRFSIAGRAGHADDGLYGARGLWGNLPAGETYMAPVEGTGEGRLVTPAGWYPGLAEDLAFRLEQGQVVEVLGGGPVGDEFRRLFFLEGDEAMQRARRNLAELGIGCNPNARRPDNVLEAEKIKGTVHIGIGDNIHMGGRVEADLHEDFVQPRPDLLVDGRPVILHGQWQA